MIGTGYDLQNFGKTIPATMPRVSLIQRTPNVPSVVADEYHGIHEAMDHLLSLGHRRICYLMLGTPLRVTAYQAALSDAGIEADARWVWQMTRGDLAAPGIVVSFVGLGRTNMRAWLEQGWEESGCTALLTQNDETALGAIESLREAGIKVPNGLSIIGFDGSEVAEYCSPPLTTVEVPLHKLGDVGTETLLRLYREEKVAHTTTLPTHLKVRETTLAMSSRNA